MADFPEEGFGRLVWPAVDADAFGPDVVVTTAGEYLLPLPKSYSLARQELSPCTWKQRGAFRIEFTLRLPASSPCKIPRLGSFTELLAVDHEDFILVMAGLPFGIKGRRSLNLNMAGGATLVWNLPPVAPVRALFAVYAEKQPPIVVPELFGAPSALAVGPPPARFELGMLTVLGARRACLDSLRERWPRMEAWASPVGLHIRGADSCLMENLILAMVVTDGEEAELCCEVPAVAGRAAIPMSDAICSRTGENLPAFDVLSGADLPAYEVRTGETPVGTFRAVDRLRIGADNLSLLASEGAPLVAAVTVTVRISSRAVRERTLGGDYVDGKGFPFGHTRRFTPYAHPLPTAWGPGPLVKSATKC